MSLTVPPSDPNALHLLDGLIQLLDDRELPDTQDGGGQERSLPPALPVAHPSVTNWLKRVFRLHAPRQELFPDGHKTD